MTAPELVVHLERDEPMLRLAAEELASFLSGPRADRVPVQVGTSSPPAEALTIRIGCGEHPAVPAAGHQAYAIVPSDRGLDLVGREPIGACYAVKTLKQAVGVTAEGVRVPRLAVSDAADLAERGFWDYFYPAPIRAASEMYTLRTAEAWFAFIDELSDYKLNLLDLLIWDEGLYYNSARFPELVQPGTPADKNQIVREVLAYARRRGVHVFLDFCHPEHFIRLLETRPDLRAVDPAGCQPSLFARMLCFSNPQTRQILAGIAEEVADLFQPDGLCAWMPEHHGQCRCAACARQGYFRQFFSLYAEAFDRIRQRQPRLRSRFLVSFLRYRDTLLHAVPPEAEIVYYECDWRGMYGAPEAKRLPDHLRAAAQAGRRLLGCVNYRGVGLKYVPLLLPDNVAEWVRLLVRDGYYGVNGSIYSNPWVYRANLLRLADVAWNAAGRSTPDYWRAYCTSQGLSRPGARALAMDALAHGWEMYHRHLGTLIEADALRWMLSRRGPNVADAFLVFYVTDHLEEHDLPLLREGLTRLEAGATVARELGDEALGLQFRACRIRLGALYDILAALHVFGRQQWPDPLKGPWEDWIAQLADHLRSARERLRELPAVTAAIRSPKADVGHDPAVTDTVVLGLLDQTLEAGFLEALARNAWPDV